MLKLAARIFDIYDDQTGEIAGQLGAEYANVKFASPDEIAALADSQFGLLLKTAGNVVRRRYPLHDADSCKLSRAYFDRVKGSLPAEIVTAVEEKIAAAEAGQPTAKLAYVDGTKLKATTEKVAFSDKHWGLTIDGRNVFPLHDADLVKTAIARFNATVETLEPEEAFLYARNIAKRASTLGVKIANESRVNLYTSDAVNLVALKDAIDDRYRVLKTAGMSVEILNQLADAAGCPIERGSTETYDSYNRRCKIAADRAVNGLCNDPGQIIGILQKVDKLAGLGREHYLRGMLDPFAACFKLDTVTKRAAMIVDGVDLSCVTPDALASKFDPEFCAKFNQQPVSSYQGLPPQMQDVLRQMCSQKTDCADVPGGGSDPTTKLDPTYVNSIALSN